MLSRNFERLSSCVFRGEASPASGTRTGTARSWFGQTVHSYVDRFAPRFIRVSLWIDYLKYLASNWLVFVKNLSWNHTVYYVTKNKRLSGD